MNAIEERRTYYQSGDVLDAFSTMLEMIASVPSNVATTQTILACLPLDILTHVQTGLTQLQSTLNTVLTERKAKDEIGKSESVNGRS